MLRSAVPDDLPALIEMGRAMHAESPNFSRYAFSADVLKRSLLAFMASADGFVVVYEREGDPVGVVVAMCARQWFSEELMACDLAVFVKPGHRGGMAAARLIGAYHLWAVKKGVRFPSLGISTGVHEEATARLYQGLGFSKQRSTTFEASDV